MLHQIELIHFIALIFLVTIVGCLLLFLALLIAPQNSENEKLSAYECGFEPFEDARHKFEIHFYLIAILFLIFDVEVVFLIPWILALSELSHTGFFAMLFFLAILVLGFIYEWKKGALDWGE